MKTTKKILAMVLVGVLLFGTTSLASDGVGIIGTDSIGVGDLNVIFAPGNFPATHQADAGDTNVAFYMDVMVVTQQGSNAGYVPPGLPVVTLPTPPAPPPVTPEECECEDCYGDEYCECIYEDCDEDDDGYYDEDYDEDYDEYDNEDKDKDEDKDDDGYDDKTCDEYNDEDYDEYYDEDYDNEEYENDYDDKYDDEYNNGYCDKDCDENDNENDDEYYYDYDKYYDYEYNGYDSDDYINYDKYTPIAAPSGVINYISPFVSPVLELLNYFSGISPIYVTFTWYQNGSPRPDMGQVTINQERFYEAIRINLDFETIWATDSGNWTLRAYAYLPFFANAAQDPVSMMFFVESAASLNLDVAPVRILPLGYYIIHNEADLIDAFSSTAPYITLNIASDFYFSPFAPAPLVISSGMNVMMHGGGRITRGNSSTTEFFLVTGGGTLTIDDVILDGNHSAGINVNQPLIRVNGGTLYMYSGTLTNNGGAAVPGWTSAAVQLMNGGIFVMNDGIISSNSGYNGGGVAVANNGSIFTMNNGTVIGNTAVNGAGVHVSSNGTFTFNSGSIDGNYATGNGGGVFVSGFSATFTMNGGTITGNTAANGAGVHVASNGSFIMQNGVIDGNTATGNGGGVFVGSGLSSFTMNNGEVNNNNGGGVYVSGGTFTMHDGEVNYSTGSGVYVNTGNFTMNGGEILGNIATAGPGVGLDVRTDSIVILNSGIIGDDFNVDNPAHVTTSAGMYFRIVCNDSFSRILEIIGTGAGTIQLAGHYSAHIDRATPIIIPSGANITIESISNQIFRRFYVSGHFIQVNGSLKIRNLFIYGMGDTGQSNGAVVNVNGIFTMGPQSVINQALNNVPGGTAGVLVGTGGIFNLNGGYIINCFAMASGVGGIRVLGTLNMTDGIVGSNGSATGGHGGIFAEPGSSVSIDGPVAITHNEMQPGNTPSNITLSNNVFITLTPVPWPVPYIPIGVRTLTPNGVFAHNATPQHAPLFTSDDPLFTCIYEANNLRFIPTPHINPAAITVTAPVYGQTRSATASATATNFTTSAATWSPNTGTSFTANTAYTVTVTFTAAAGYTFPAVFTATINGYNATVTTNTNPGAAANQVTITFTFPPTTTTTSPAPTPPVVTPPVVTPTPPVVTPPPPTVPPTVPPVMPPTDPPYTPPSYEVTEEQDFLPPVIIEIEDVMPPLYAQPPTIPDDQPEDEPAYTEEMPELPPTERLLRFTVGSYTFLYRGAELQTDVAPFIDPSYNRIMVPLRVIAEAMGANVVWTHTNQTVTITTGGSITQGAIRPSVTLTIGTALPDGMGTPVIQNSRTLVPLRYVVEVLGADVYWDYINQAVYVYEQSRSFLVTPVGFAYLTSFYYNNRI